MSRLTGAVGVKRYDVDVKPAVGATMRAPEPLRFGGVTLLAIRASEDIELKAESVMFLVTWVGTSFGSPVDPQMKSTSCWRIRVTSRALETSMSAGARFGSTVEAAARAAKPRRPPAMADAGGRRLIASTPVSQK